LEGVEGMAEAEEFGGDEGAGGTGVVDEADEVAHLPRVGPGTGGEVADEGLVEQSGGQSEAQAHLFEQETDLFEGDVAVVGPVDVQLCDGVDEVHGSVAGRFDDGDDALAAAGAEEEEEGDGDEGRLVGVAEVVAREDDAQRGGGSAEADRVIVVPVERGGLWGQV
jgi:hypothetical protein